MEKTTMKLRHLVKDKYRNILEFTPGRLLYGGVVLGGALVAIAVAVLALGNWGPLVKKEVRRAVTIVISTRLMRVVVIRGRIIVIVGRRRRHPFLLPLPHGAVEYGGRRAVPGRRAAEPGPHSLHLAAATRVGYDPG